MTEVKAPVRILQSGKVYRQMFDAEVQLMKSLDASKLRNPNISSEKFSLPDLTATASEVSRRTCSSSPSIFTQNGTLLTNRQKTWTEGMPNDGITENPVLYRQISAVASRKIKQLSVDDDVNQVNGLPNIVRPLKLKSDINERIAERRKERHEKCLEEMHNKLCSVSSRSEPRITVIGENLQSQLKEDDIIITTLFKSISSDDELINFSFDKLGELWSNIESHSSKRRRWIEDAHNYFNEIEDERLEAISELLKTYCEKLEKIAFLLSPDVHRLIEKEAMMINQSVLANRRSYAKLHINLLEGDIEREVDQHRSWLERVKDWKKLNAELAVRQFTGFMKSETVCQPSQISNIMEKSLHDQKALSEKRQIILDQIKEMKPPFSTKPSVLKWNTALVKCHEDLDALHSKMVRSLHHEYESICQICLAEIEKYKKNLILSNVCDEEDMKRIVNNHLLPQVGTQLKLFEKKLEEMDKHLEEVASVSEREIKDLFKFVHGAAHLWDVHGIGMKRQDRKLQNELEQAREAHDTANQEREMKLDVTLDRLRQESTEEALNQYLDQCLSMLTVIKNGYITFHKEELERIKKYPEMIESEITIYEEGLCNYFQVAPKIDPQLQIEENEEEKEKNENQDGEVKKENEEVVIEEDAVDMSNYEILVTDHGTEFYIIPPTNEEVAEEKVDETDAKDKEPEEKITPQDYKSLSQLSTLPDYIEHIQIQPGFITELKERVRLVFFNHLDEWKINTRKNAESHTQEKSDELEAELDLRFHLHAPRAKRIEIDVRNVRAAELILHRDRVGRHCKGITAALDSLKTDFVEMTRNHDDEAIAFRNETEKMESLFITTNKSSKLNSLNEKMQTNLANYIDNVKTSLRNFRQLLDTTLGKLRESNAHCARSFKLFCEGGNFSPDETVPLRKRLEKMSQRVDNAEGAVMRDLEGMESKRIEQGTEWVNKAEERFRSHFNDLSFSEAMQRWATNAQVHIKSEAAYSNGMAAELSGHLETLRRRVDACEKPSFDKEAVSTELLHEYALDIIEVLHKRASYLNCNVVESNTPVKAEDVDLHHVLSVEPPRTATDRTLGSANRKSVVQLGSRQSMEGVGSWRNRQPSDDAAIGVIKTILRAPKEKTILDVDDVRSTATGTTRAPPSTANSTAVFSSRLGKNLSKGGGSTTSTPEPLTSRRSVNDGVTVTYKRRDTKFDGKYMVFGSKPVEGNHWIAKINQALYNSLDGMLSTAEIYYKQKGMKPCARPQLIQESFDSCAEKVAEKLLKYEKQAEEFHNDSLQDFRKLLHDIEYDLCHVPRLVLNDLLQNKLESLKDQQQILERNFQDKEKNWESQKQSHKIELRPTMGHPDQDQALCGVNDLERQRQEEQSQGIEDHANNMLSSLHGNASRFVESISTVTNQLLKEFNKLLTIDDVIVGKVPPRKDRTSVLIRRRNDGYEMSEVADPSFGVKPIIERGAGKWPTCDFTQLGINESVLPDSVKETQETSRTTLPQAKAVEFRDMFFSKYVSKHDSTTDEINATKSRRIQDEERWRKNWKESIKRVKSLYK